MNNDQHVRVDNVAGLGTALEKLGVRGGRPVLVLVGGAGGISAKHLRLVRELLGDILPVLAARDAVVVDGGTDSGVMKVIGELNIGAITLVGVAAEGALGDVALEPNHVHVLVPGNTWGDESPWLAEVASVIAGRCKSATLLVNGGEITYADAERSIDRERPVVVIAGTGRTADAIASGVGVRAERIAASPFTNVATVADVVAVLERELDTSG